VLCHNNEKYYTLTDIIFKMSKLKLKIVTPEEQIFDGEVDGVNVYTSEGELGILPNHAPLMAKVIPGELTIKQSGKQENLALGFGFLQIIDNTLTVMADLATKATDIDERAVEEARKRAEQALTQKLTDEEHAETLAILQKSVAQLKIRRRHHNH
jgi:F-type H+-transporting ATPase subunit epsilon